ncbi:MAG: hypothetical protein HON90_12870 [Halobacteriovoraceae bacterium]|nr:hypothetical protein [Halobacteriovoraceae bacterium]
MLQAKQACLFPEPPGMLSFSKTLEIAEEISNQYKNKSILSLRGKSNKITKKTMIKLARAVIKNQVQDLLIDGQNVDKFISNLKSFKSLEKSDPDNITNHMDMIFSQNIPFEIIDSLLPSFSKDHLGGVLPESMSKAEKNNFIKTDIYPTLNTLYQQCIAPIKERIIYDLDIDLKQDEYVDTDIFQQEKKMFSDHEEKISLHRKKIQSSYCRKNPKECKKNACQKKVNLSTLRTDISDNQQIQACMYQAITKTLKPILSKSISVNAAPLMDKFNLSDKNIELIDKAGNETLSKCIDDKSKIISNKKYSDHVTDNIEAFYHIPPDKFKEMLFECGNQSEKDVVTNIATFALMETPIVSEFFNDKVEVNFMGKTIDEGVFNFAKMTSSQAIDKCIDAQKKNVSISETSASVCAPIIEMRAARQIVFYSLKDLLKKANLKDPDYRVVLDQYKKCTKEAVNIASSSYFNEDAKNPIFDAQDAEVYLDSNSTFLTCLKESIASQDEKKDSISKIMALQTLKEKEEGFMKELEGKEYYNKIKPDIVKNVSTCLSTELNKIPKWSSFVELNEQNGVEKIKTLCQEQATEFALPKMILNEATLKLAPLNKSQITNLNSKQLALLINKEYGIESKSKDPKESIKLVYKQYKKRYPTKELSEFTNDFQKRIKLATINKIKTEFINEISLKENEDPKLSKLREAIPATCLDSIHANHEDMLAELAKKVEDLPPTIPPQEENLKKFLVELIHGGVARAKKVGRYDLMIKDLAKLCSNPKSHKDLSIFKRLRIGENTILDQIQTKIQVSLTDAMIEQCTEEVLLHDFDFTQEDKEIICPQSFTYKDDFKNYSALMLHYQSSLESKEKQAEFGFLTARYAQSRNIIDQHINEEFIDELFYKNKDLTNQIYDNFEKILLRDQDLFKKLSLLSVNKIFSNLKRNSFADEFLKLQLTAGIGIEGHDEAKDKVKLSLTKLPVQQQPFRDRITPAAFDIFYKKWNTKGINYYLQWDNIEASVRENLLAQMIDKEVIPRVKKSLTQTNQKKKDTPEVNRTLSSEEDMKKSEELRVTLREHIDNYGVFDVKDDDEAKKISFSEKMNADITDETKDLTINNLESDVNDVVESLEKKLLKLLLSVSESLKNIGNDITDLIK